MYTLGFPVFKIMGKIFIFQFAFWSNLQQIVQISHILPTIPTNYAKFTTKFIHIHSKLSDFWPSAGNSRKLEWITQILCILPTVTVNYTKFAHMASNLEVNPVNSRKIQWITQILHHSHPTAGKLHEIRDICTQTGKLRTFFTHIYAHCYSTCMHTFCTILD